MVQVQSDAHRLSIAFVLAYGEPYDGFFPDTLAAQLCAQARDAGHRAEIVRVYYDGKDATKDREVARRLDRWLEERDIDLVVLERLFDPTPIQGHLGRAPHRRSAIVTRGDSVDPVAGVDFIVGAAPGLTRAGTTRRSPTVAELGRAFQKLVEAVAIGADPTDLPGVAGLVHGELHLGPPIERVADREPYRAVVEQDVIALDTPPRVVRKTLFGNVGCPFADDPMDNPHFAGVALPANLAIARLGCAFCSMGGDYEKRADEEAVRDVVEQASFWARSAPEVEEFVLSDQHAVRYLASVVYAAHRAGIRPMRWLFAARADAFVRERARIDAAIAAASATGHRIETYLTGFESFSDAELARYNKGATVADSIEAVQVMRELRSSQPTAFDYAGAKGHSLILWSPWTEPSDLAQSVRVIRDNGLGELFHEIGRNRLRLYPDLPIYYAAERDGALAEAWETGDEGAARRKGYSVERPWRFLDPRTRVAHDIAQLLRERLGTDTEVGQLSAVVPFADRAEVRSMDPAAATAAVAEGLHALEIALGRLGGATRDPAAPRAGASLPARVVFFAGACNNNCAACSNRDAWLDDRPEALFDRIDEARRQPGPIMLAGREPTIHPAFLAAVERARGPESRAVGVVTNARRFAYRAFARAAAAAGLVGASVKVFAAPADVADAIGGAPGGHAQALDGIVHLGAAGIGALELRAPLYADNLATFERIAEVAATATIQQIRIEAALDAIGLDRLGDAARAVERLSARCRRDGLALDASPLSAAARRFDALPLLAHLPHPAAR